MTQITAFPTLWGKDSKGKLRQWDVVAVDGSVEMVYGLVDGKKTVKKIPCVGKNIGKANETTPESQAKLEAEAKWVKQKKSGYFETVEEAMAYQPKNPMLAKDYKDHKAKVGYPCYIQPKLNGVRLLTDAMASGWSKSGEPMTHPAHWRGVEEFAKSTQGLDGEMYAGLGGLSLQAINSARQNDNEDTLKLRYYVYDLPHPNKTQKQRLEELRIIEEVAPEWVVIVPFFLVKTEEEGDALHKKFVAMGYEGSVYRDVNGMYEFEKRSNGLIKRKPRQTAEGRIISVQEDRIGQGLCTVECLNGSQKGKLVDMLMKKDSVPGMNARLYANALMLVDQTIEYAYEELSDELIPTKPVGERLREVDENGESKD